jgi:hypothetical protein
MGTILVMLMQVIFPGGVSYDIVVRSAPAPSAEACETARVQLPSQALVAEDGTILRTYYECKTGV